MKKILPLLTALFLLAHAQSQFVYKIKADSVLITNDTCTAELIIENSTKGIKGFLYNKGNGRTEFRKVTKLNDSTLIFGEDTLLVQGSGNFWKLKGNAGTDTSVNFIGTTDTQALVFKTNNTPVMMIEKYNAATWRKAAVGIGTRTPHTNYRLHINVHDVQPPNSLVPFYTGSVLGVDEGPTRITQVTAGADFDRPYFTTVKANGTLASPTAVTSNSRLGTFETWGYDGTNILPSGALEYWVDGTPSTGIIPTAIHFSTGTTTGGVTRNMVLRASGRLGLGTTSPVYKLHVITDSVLGIASVSTKTLSATSGGFFNAISATGNPSASGQRLGGLNMGCNTAGGTYRHTASIAAFSEDTWAANGTSVPTYLSFYTTASGSGTPAERLRITAAGNVGINTTSPSAKLHVNGTGQYDSTLTTAGNRVAIASVTGNTTLTDKSECVFGNATGGAFNVTLPSASGRDGQRYTIKKTDNSANAVTVNTTSSQTIDGATTYALAAQWNFVTVVASGGNWLIIAK